MLTIGVLLLFGAGCGNKGPLYLPEPDPVTPPVPAAPAEEDEQAPAQGGD